MKRSLEYYQQLYAKTCLEHGDATEKGDYRRGNKAADQNTKAIAEIRKTPDQGRQFLLGLLEHPSPWVRALAATDLLFIEPEKASALLEGFSRLKTPWQLGADCGIVLKEWRAGRLKPRA